MSIITDTSVESKTETITAQEIPMSAAEKFKALLNGEIDMKPEVITYEVRMMDGEGEWTIEADDYNILDKVMIFLKEGKVTFIVGLNNLVYANPKED